MPIGHNEINLRGPARAQVLEDAHPAIFALFGTGTPREHLFVSSQVHSQRRQDHRRIRLLSMTHAEIDAIQVQDTPALMQPALTPGRELLLQITVEPTDTTGTGRYSQQAFGNFPDGCRVLTPATNISLSPWAICGS